MAVIKCDEMPGREGRISLAGFERFYKRTFQVVVNDRNEAAAIVKNANLGAANRVPRLGESYAAGGILDAGAICDDLQAIDPEPEFPFLWHVVATYRSRAPDLRRQQSGGGGGGGSPESPQGNNPLFQAPKVNWGTKGFMRPVLQTSASEPIANSAGTPFDPPEMQEVRVRTLRIQRNEPEFRPFSTLYLVNSLNEKPFQHSTPGTVLCEDIVAEYHYDNGLQYFTVTYDFVFAPDSDPFFFWIRRIDKGPIYIDYRGDPNGLVGQAAEFTSRTGRSIPEVYLDPGTQPTTQNLNGTFVGQLHPSTDPDTGLLRFGARPNIRRFLTKDINDFSTLSLPDPAWL